MVRYRKSMVMLFGLFALVLLFTMSAYAQLGFGGQQPPQKSQHTPLASAQGRFVFGQISDSNNDQFMLDTATGRLWRLTKRTDIGVCLSTVPYRSSEGECSALPETTSALNGSKAKKQ